jgi:hypothetical protein
MNTDKKQKPDPCQNIFRLFIIRTRSAEKESKPHDKTAPGGFVRDETF